MHKSFKLVLICSVVRGEYGILIIAIGSSEYHLEGIFARLLLARS